MLQSGSYGLHALALASSSTQILPVAGCAHRGLSVLSWGRNTEHQCGIEGQQPLITQPTAVLELLQQPVNSVVAGRNNSAAVVGGSEVFVWGEGSCGKLGLGSGDSAGSPSRIEAFVGRSAIKAVSLGQHHSLFLDQDGHLWAAGENKEGQCGLGTPLAELARQHRQAYDDAMRRIGSILQQHHHRPNSDKYAQHLRAASAASAATASADAPHIAQGWGSLDSSWRRPHSADWGGSAGAGAGGLGGNSSMGGRSRSWLSAPWDRQGGGGAGARMGSGFSPNLGRSGLNAIGYLPGGEGDLQAHMQALQMQPGQTHTPARVGCGDTHMLLLEQQQLTLEQQQQGLDITSSGDGTSSSTSSSMGSPSGGLSGEEVVGMAASKFFSIALTAKGEVWTFGACYNGALGSGEGSSWQTSATRVSAPISEAIAARGGAVAVAAGATFSAVLTASGRVLQWGKLVTHGHSRAGGSSSSNTRLAATAEDDVNSSSSSSSSTEGWCEVALPEGVHIKHIAAGQQHLLMSDGERVWAVGRWMDQSGHEAGTAPAAAPAELLALPGSGIVKLAAGMHASAVVDGDGRLWVWGRLLDQVQAQAVANHGAVLPVGGSSSPAAAAAIMQAAEMVKRLQQVDWGWAGFGGEAPRVVEGVHGVRDVALGGWHALALVD